jgi:hypothetical protein
VEEKAAEPEAIFEVGLNPKLGFSVDGAEVDGRFFKGGERVTASDYESLKGAKATGRDGAQVQVLLKIREVK